jgi:crotonobetainyl-CoA:carnitine CoA-transferase CaiB-like acyl-CoA transferase
VSVGSATGDWYLIAIPDAETDKRLRDHIGTATLEEWGARLSNAEIESALSSLKLEFTLVFDGLSIARSPYFQARGDVIDTEHPGVGKITASGRLDGSRPEPAYRAPGLGEDNAAVFGRLLGLDGAELEKLAADGVI